MITQPSDIYPKIAAKHNVSVEAVREIVIWFYRQGVKRSLESATKSEIYINKLGSFKAKGYKLKYLISDVIKHMSKPDMDEDTVQYYKGFIDRLEMIQKELEEKKIKNQEFRELNKKNSRDIPEQKEDLGGT